MPSGELKALRLVPNAEDKLKAIFRCRVIECPMVKTLDQQLADLRDLANKIKEKFGIDLGDTDRLVQRLEAGAPDEEGVELIRQMLMKFFLLDEYIDKLR